MAEKLPSIPEEGESPAPKRSHPPVDDMVDDAISSLNDKGDVSIFAIKKFIAENYEVDLGMLSREIKDYLISSVHNRHLVRTNGTGANGSFNFAADKSPPLKIKMPLYMPPKKKAKKSKKTA